MTKGIVWFAYSDQEYEGIQELLGVFSTAIQAKRAIDKHDPPLENQKWEGSLGSYWRDMSAGRSYYVVRLPIGKICSPDL